MLGALIGAAASIGGGLLASSSAKKAAAKQAALQREFAQNAIQWKAEDARKAGISPLYALGANTTSYQPVSTGGSDYGLSQAGQDIGRAIDAQNSAGGRAQHFAVALARTQLEGAQLDNEFKRVELASAVARHNQAGTPPPYPSMETVPHVPGQGNSTLEVTRKMSPSSPIAGTHVEAGVAPEVSFYRTKHGWAPMIPQNLGEAMESQPLGSLLWAMRNQVMPWFKNEYKSEPFKAPLGKVWVMHPSGDYRLVDAPYSRNWARNPPKWR